MKRYSAQQTLATPTRRHHVFNHNDICIGCGVSLATAASTPGLYGSACTGVHFPAQYYGTPPQPAPELTVRGHDYWTVGDIYICKRCSDSRTPDHLFAWGAVPECGGVEPKCECECGAAKVGIADFGVGHSAWCDVAEGKR